MRIIKCSIQGFHYELGIATLLKGDNRTLPHIYLLVAKACDDDRDDFRMINGLGGLDRTLADVAVVVIHSTDQNVGDGRTRISTYCFYQLGSKGRVWIPGGLL